MNVLSLFDGMSCGQIALERAGVAVSNYYASEIDKYAIKVTQANYPSTKQLGDITKWREWDLEDVDLIMGGSPCQGFSFAGKQLNFKDPRSALFFTFVDILKHYKPKYFLLENVRMKKEYQDKISELLGVEPICINSNLVSGQNRVRYYWTNIPDIAQPGDREIYLADILERDVSSKFCLDESIIKKDSVTYTDVAAFTERRTEEAKRIRREYRQLYGRDFSPRRGKELVAREDGKMNCLTATYSIKEHTLIDEQLYYRKLTPIECERLQTVTDNYTNHVSNTQRYKMLGNGWTVDVVSHIFKNIS